MRAQLLAGLRLGCQRGLCVLISAALVLNPVREAILFATTVGWLVAPRIGWAQTAPPAPAAPPPGAAEGQALGQSLLHGPSTNGTQVFFDGANGTESISVDDLFQPSGSTDDTAAMSAAFGDNNAANGLSTAVEARLGTENSQQGEAYRTITQSAQSHSHPDLINDPALQPSASLLTGNDPIFSSFFSGCQQTQVSTGTGGNVHVPDLQYCDRVVTPTPTCDITHDYTVGLIELVGGDGTMQSCGPGCLDVLVGKQGDNYWTGSCTIFEQTVTLQVDNAAAITSATLADAEYDDYMQVLINGNKVWQGPNANFPPEIGSGPCDLRTNWRQNPNTDITAAVKNNGVLAIKTRTSVGGVGEGFARIRIQYDQNKIATQDQWTISPECHALITAFSDGACTQTSMTCLDGPAMDVPCITSNGFQVCQNNLSPGPVPGYSPLCLKGEIVGNCQFSSGPMQCWTDPNGVQQCPSNDGSQPNGCATYENNSSCAFISSSCLPFAQGKSGSCYAYDETWDCGYNVSLPGGTATQTTCDGPIRCMGEQCVSPPTETNGDFAKAAGMLQAMNFMAMDTHCANNDPSQCEVFAGEAMTCKKAVAGWVNCCDSPVTVSLTDYLRLTMATYDLAKKLELGQKLADAGLNVPGAWDAVRNFASSTWSTITEPFTSAWGSLTQSYGGAAVDEIESFSLAELKQDLMNETAKFVSNTFGDQVASIFFTQTTNEAGEEVTELSDTFATALSVIMWIYTIYIIVNILVHLIWKCEQNEFLLDARRQMSLCDRMGSYCAENSPFGCIETKDAYCCYTSPLGRIVMESANLQFGLDSGTPQNPNCAGLSIAQLGQLDWNKVDLSQWYAILAHSGLIPSDTAGFDTQYALDNVTRNQNATLPTPDAPERIQHEVDAAQYFDEARAKIRTDLWNGAVPP